MDSRAENKCETKRKIYITRELRVRERAEESRIIKMKGKKQLFNDPYSLEQIKKKIFRNPFFTTFPLPPVYTHTSLGKAEQVKLQLMTTLTNLASP